MSNRKGILGVTFLVYSGLIFFATFNAQASSIYGFIYDNHHNTLADVDVELSGNVGAFRNHTRSDSTGKYEFEGLADGQFTVNVLPFRYDYESQSQEIYLQSISAVGGTGTTSELVDFYLMPRKGSLSDYEAKVVFAQEIPSEAKTHYSKATSAIAKKQTDIGISELKSAIDAFPKYFQALLDLGKIYYVKGEYNTAAKLFIKAADINNRSAMSFFFCGDSLRRLGYDKAAYVALNQAYVLVPSSSQILKYLGMVERNEGKYIDSETHLKQASKFTRNPDPEIFWELAQLYNENLKKYSAAADQLELFLKARPDAKDAVKIKEAIKKLREKSQTTTS